MRHTVLLTAVNDRGRTLAHCLDCEWEARHGRYVDAARAADMHADDTEGAQ